MQAENDDELFFLSTNEKIKKCRYFTLSGKSLKPWCLVINILMEGATHIKCVFIKIKGVSYL